MKILLILTLLISHFSLYAQDCVNCSVAENPTSLEKSIMDLKESIVINCTDQLKSDAENEYQENFGKLPKKTAVVYGLKLTSSQEELNFLDKMLGAEPTAKWSKARSCTDVLCALTAVYNSQEAAQRALNIAKKHGYIVSIGNDFTIDKKPVGQLFSLDELQTIDLAYKQLPPNYKRLKSLERLKRMPDGLTPTSLSSGNAVAAYARPKFYSREGEIAFLDNAFNVDKTWGALVAIHELAHHVDFSKSDKTSAGLSEVTDFLKISGWKKKTSYKTDAKGNKIQEVEWVPDANKKFVTTYAATHPAEDLADSAAYYVLEPQKLKKMDPEKYDYIKKNLFGGKEYLNEPDLMISNNELLSECMKQVNEIPIYGAGMYVKEIESSCLNKFVDTYEVIDPKLCNYSKDQIKTYLFDKLGSTIEETNTAIKDCSNKMTEHRNACMNENDYRKNCPIKKCNLNESVKEKIRDTSYYDRKDRVMTDFKKKVGLGKLTTKLLTAALSEKMNVSYNFSLNRHRDFLDRATPEFLKMLSESNFKFDENESITSNAQYFVSTDKELTQSLDSFQQTVLKSADKSKEKNLELIKAWAKSQSFEDSPEFVALADALSTQKKGRFDR